VASKPERYEGSLVLPGQTEPRAVSVSLDEDATAVKISFTEPAAGSMVWEGSDVFMARRLKYVEVTFRTTGLPQETVELVWKINASLLDDTLAGVIVVKPNEVRVSGERGFILSRAG
jgi:hypothetical protein